MKIRLEISEITEENKKEKLEKAIKHLSEKMGVPATIEHKEHNKEQFPYQAQEELYQRYINKIGLIMDDLYSRICATLDMRPVSTFRKAIDPDAISLLKKHIYWNPETGQPVTHAQLERLINAIDKFLNRNIGPLKKEFVLNQAAISKIIANLKTEDNIDELRKKSAEDLKYKRHGYDYFDSYSKLNDVFPANYDRLKFRERVVGNYITDMNDKIISQVRNIVDDGYLSGKTKHQIAQELFDKFGGLNKDWDRIVDTESTNIFNSEYIQEELSDAEPGEPVYFIRREFGDAKTCSFCRQAVNKPVIAKWSDVPLADDKIKDPYASIAIWSGKSNAGLSQSDWTWPEAGVHPRCRGGWDRWYPEIGTIDLRLKEK